MEAKDGLQGPGYATGGGMWKKGAQSTTGITLPTGGGRSLQGSVSPRLHASSVYPGGLHLTLTL